MNTDKKKRDNIYLLCTIKCEICGVDYMRSNSSTHRKSKFHIGVVEKYMGGMITDPEEFNRLRSILYGRKGY